MLSSSRKRKASDTETKRWTKSSADELAVRNGCRFSEENGLHVVEFFSKQLRHTTGQWAGKPFIPLPWQRDDVLMPIFGWQEPSGCRRYRVAYIEVPKKNGKSGLCSGIAVYLLGGDGERGAQVYCVAASRDQAGIVYREASAMAQASPLLKGLVVPSDSIKNLALPSRGSFLRAISRESFTAEGLNIHGLIFDELHAQKSRDLWDALKYGGAARRQPLNVSITTAGFDRHSICHEQHQKALGILDGTIEDDSFFAYVRAAGEKDDWKSPETWRKANPSLGVTIRESDFARECQEAQESIAKENVFKRYRLNIWTQQATRWLKMEQWDSCSGDLRPDDLQGKKCFAGLDLASTKDVAALVLVFPLGNLFAVLPFFWVPEVSAEKRQRNDGVKYLTWAKAGLLELTPGEAIDTDYIRTRLNLLAAEYQIEKIGVDRWNAMDLIKNLKADGFNLEGFGQGFKSMTGPTKELEKLVIGRRLVHWGNPVLRWMAGNVSVETDAAANLKPSKEKSSEKIDGIVATIMALGMWMANPVDNASVYETRGLKVL